MHTGTADRMERRQRRAASSLLQDVADQTGAGLPSAASLDETPLGNRSPLNKLKIFIGLFFFCGCLFFFWEAISNRQFLAVAYPNLTLLASWYRDEFLVSGERRTVSCHLSVFSLVGFRCTYSSE